MSVLSRKRKSSAIVFPVKKGTDPGSVPFLAYLFANKKNMCGIVGYIGDKQAAGILLEGLKRLEYRGYDSAGIGVIDTRKNEIVIRKAPGKIRNLQELIKSHPLPSATVGISHTRWATHGAPSKVNAHPHSDYHQKIIVVHNGIIENYQDLKNRLKKQGFRFISETDTEVVAHLIRKYYQGDLVNALVRCIRDIKGAFALGIISSDHPDTIVAARIGSPLVVGLGKGENFIASDVPAILNRTRRVIYLKDGEITEIKKDRVHVFSFSGKRVYPRVDEVTYRLDAVKKQGFAHFMLKEIHEQPRVLAQMYDSRVKNGVIHFEELAAGARVFKESEEIMLVACGTAYHAGLAGKYILEALARITVMIDVSSEFRYRNPMIGRKTLVIAISQSGETADTLAAVKEAKKKGAKVLAICNVVGSSLVRESDGVIYTHAGPEIGVASTKAYTAQLYILYLLALYLGRLKKGIPLDQYQHLLAGLKAVPRLYEKILKKRSSIARIAHAHSHYGCFLYLGRNINYPSALEGALKLKEISYIPAEGYAAGEMKHGPIALIDEYRAVVCIAPQSEIYEKMISNIQEICSRKGNVIALASEGDKAIRQYVPHVIDLPRTHNLLTPLLAAIPLQLLAYYIAVKRGCDVDQPRNLAKSVTVE